MKNGFIKVAAVSPDIRVADTEYNAKSIIADIKHASDEGVKLVVFPELSITSATCGDLFMQKVLIDKAEDALSKICAQTTAFDIISVVGMPLMVNNCLYDCAVVLNKGQIKGVVPKTNINRNSSKSEYRHFAKGHKKTKNIKLLGQEVPFGENIIFVSEKMKDFTMAIEFGNDLLSPLPPSVSHAINGANIILNLSAENETVTGYEKREMLVKAQALKLNCAYIYANSGEGESSTDLVFSGDSMICENGKILARSKRFENDFVYTELDLEKLTGDRRKNFNSDFCSEEEYLKVKVDFNIEETKLTRKVNKLPFVPENEEKRDKRCEEILTMQATGLKKRLLHTGIKNAVLGISGGLDSTLALLVTVRAFKMAGLDTKNILSITMPCFGTTNRTYNNAVNFSKALSTTFKEINIKEAVKVHFKDIGQSETEYDITFENAQARERTQVLMDVANKNSALVIGTGDMSELALGFATYNGDHMSMYGVNAGVPKTLIRYIVEYEAEKTDNILLKDTLMDILNTPVSPELLPPNDGDISQKTESIVGPYELHDFFMYYILRHFETPDKILRLAELAFSGVYDRQFILDWLKIFCKRFFSQQFKRSSLPDGPKVGRIGLSPRGDWQMPSDASVRIWMDLLNEL